MYRDPKIWSIDVVALERWMLFLDDNFRPIIIDW